MKSTPDHIVVVNIMRELGGKNIAYDNLVERLKNKGMSKNRALKIIGHMCDASSLNLDYDYDIVGYMLSLNPQWKRNWSDYYWENEEKIDRSRMTEFTSEPVVYGKSSLGEIPGACSSSDFFFSMETAKPKFGDAKASSRDLFG